MSTTVRPDTAKEETVREMAVMALYEHLYHPDCVDPEFGLESWTFAFDDAKRRAGAATFGPNVITLSRSFVEHASFEEIENTILHEVAHAIAGLDAGHGPRWRMIARDIGCSAERCADMPESMPKGRYEATCSECGAEGLGWRWRLSDRVRNHAVHNQGTCRGRIVWKDHG
jgi:predicted SprT family Zn-dependent metalloprotease